MIYFTSDHHFGHTNIIQYCNRPFKDTLEMDVVMIQRWNAVVQPDDVVYYLGDFTLKGWIAFLEYRMELNGIINFLYLPHHHDGSWQKTKKTYKTDEYIRQGSVIMVEDTLIILSHFPFEVWDRSHYNSLHLHGHCHGNSPSILPNRHDVGVDNWDYTPITLEQIMNSH